MIVRDGREPPCFARTKLSGGCFLVRNRRLVARYVTTVRIITWLPSIDKTQPQIDIPSTLFAAALPLDLQAPPHTTIEKSHANCAIQLNHKTANPILSGYAAKTFS